MHRQSSRMMYNPDTIDCIVNTNDLEFEDERNNQTSDQKRTSNDSRKINMSKYSNDRSNRHSPPLVTHKRSSSPALTPMLTSHSQHYYHISQKHQAVSRSPSPPSRHHHQKRPPTSTRRYRSRSRSHSRSRSSRDQHKSSSNRSQPTIPKKRSNDIDESIPMPSTKKTTTSSKINKKQDINDLSIISEDDAPKKVQDNQIKSSTINEPPLTSSITNIHSTPTVANIQSNFDNDLLDTSNNLPECELSLFAKSNLSVPNTSLIQPTSNLPTYDLLQTIDLMSKYKTMDSIPSNSPQIEACSKEIFQLIQKQIHLHKKVLECREREMNLYEHELAQREKKFDKNSNPTTIEQPEFVVQSTVTEEKPQQDSNNVLPSKSIPQSIPANTDASKTRSSEKPLVPRRLNQRSRFDQPTVNKSIFNSESQLITDLYKGIDEDNPSISSINSTNTLKNTDLSPVLAPKDSIEVVVDHDLKVTSSNSCRTVEIQSDNVHQTVTTKEPSQDLRITLRNNRSKQQSVDETKDLVTELINISQEPVTTFKPILTKTISNTDNKQQSHDTQQQLQQQRSITSTSIDDTISKRDHRQQHNPREHDSSSSTTSNDRSHSQKSSKYESNQKRHTNDDLRSRIDEHKYKNPSRPTHRSNR